MQTGDSWGPIHESTFHATEELNLIFAHPLLSSFTGHKMIVAPSPHIKDWRRRSADVGGLHLATENSGQGQGWMGGHPSEIEYVNSLAKSMFIN